MSNQFNKGSRSSPTRTAASKQKLPKAIRDELRMTCALRGYSTIRTGSGMKIRDQQEKMEQFYHGIEGNIPSQIQLLSEAKVEYADLYESTDIAIVTKKGSKRKKMKANATDRKHLNQTMSRDESAFYYVGTDIRYHDLKLKNRTGETLLNGRQLLDMAKRGLKDYRKAMAFTGDMWDLKKNTPIASGTTAADTIEYVRRKMYLYTTKDIDREEDEDQQTENEIINEMNKKKKATSTKVADDDDNDDNSDDDDNNDNDDYDDNNKHDDNKKYDDNDKSDDNDKHDENNENDDNDDDDDYNVNDDDSSEEEDFVPDNYIFHSFFVYSMWGPFADENKQLTLFSLASININKQRLMHQQNKQKLVAFSVQASAIQTQIDSAERRAERRCPEYDKNDSNWKIVDELLIQQNKVSDMITQHNLNLMKPEGNP